MFPPPRPATTVAPTRGRRGDPCFRCEHLRVGAHKRHECTASHAHAQGLPGGFCPHDRDEVAYITPDDSISQVGSAPGALLSPDYSFRSVVGRRGQSLVNPSGPQLATIDSIRRENPRLTTLTDAQAQRMADMYNEGLRELQRQTVEEEIRSQGLDPAAILGPTQPPAGLAPLVNPLAAPQQTPATHAPGATGLHVFNPAPQQVGNAVLVNDVEIGHITMRHPSTIGTLIHRANYTPAELQPALTAAGAGTFARLRYLGFRYILPPPTFGWRLLIRITNQAALQAQVNTSNGFTALGGTLIELNNQSPPAGLESVALPDLDLAIPIQIHAWFISASTTAGNAVFARLSIEVGATATP